MRHILYEIGHGRVCFSAMVLVYDTLERTPIDDGRNCSSSMPVVCRSRKEHKHRCFAKILNSIHRHAHARECRGILPTYTCARRYCINFKPTRDDKACQSKGGVVTMEKRCSLKNKRLYATKTTKTTEKGEACRIQRQGAAKEQEQTTVNTPSVDAGAPESDKPEGLAHGVHLPRTHAVRRLQAPGRVPRVLRYDDPPDLPSWRIKNVKLVNQKREINNQNGMVISIETTKYLSISTPIHLQRLCLILHKDTSSDEEDSTPA